MILEDFMYRKFMSADFISFEEETKILPIRIKNRYNPQDEYYDFEQSLWLPVNSTPKPEGYPTEFAEFPSMPESLVSQRLGFDVSDDLDAQEMKLYLTVRYFHKRYEYNFKNFSDCNNIKKDYVKARITTDTDSLTLKITFYIFKRSALAKTYYEKETPAFREETLFFDMKNGIVDFSSFPEFKISDSENRSEKILPYSVIEKAFERLLELAEQFTHISFDQYREQLKTKKTTLYEFYKITMLPMCPELYEILNYDNIKNRHKHFRYKRTDSKIFNHFCRKYKIRNTKILRKCFIKRPDVLDTYLHLKDCGFRDINLYNRVITSEENSQRIQIVNPNSLIFFCRYSIKKRGQKATMNTILKDTGPYENYFDGLIMFAKYFKHIPESLKTDILTDGFTQFNHDALANIAYRYENKNITFTYTDEQKRLEDDIDGYSFRLPENSYQLCEIGTSLHNCVATYSSSVKDKACTIVYATKDDKYEICIEVRKNEVWQQRMDHNKNPDKEQQEVLSKWRTRHNLQLR